MKRSSQVALLLMGVTGAGAATYSLAPSRACVPTDRPAAVAPSTAVPGAASHGAMTSEMLGPGAASLLRPANPCPPRRRWSWGRGSDWSFRSYYYDSSSPSTSPSTQTTRRSLFSPSARHTSVPTVGRGSSSRSTGTGGSGSRGGFGSTGHSVGAHSSGG
jgi:hypothetical protein